ncbi:MAG: SusC/RagA family TonB-linked outer membrane protein [Myxococcales bacterium]|nr:SusC/RagA family TonB-linked outer membrane protein [Myxococcales bacterium]
MLKKRFTPLGQVMCALAPLLLSVTAFAQNARPAAPARQAAKAREVTGIITDLEGKPVANATVAVSGGGPTTTTGADGAFKLSVATTNVMVDVSADGYTPHQLQLFGAATPLQLQLTLVKVAAPVTETRMVGGVVSDTNRAPIAGATVRVHGTTIQALTNADGTFSLPGVAVTEVVLDVEAPNQPPTTVTVPADRATVVVAVGEVKVVPAAPTTRTVRGKVLDPDSKEPIAGAQVQIAGTENVVFTDGDGTFVIENLPVGIAKLEVSAPEHETRLLEVGVERETVDVPLALAKGEQIVIEGRAPVIMKSSLANGSSTISGKDLTRVSAQTIDEAMNAKLPGANMQANSGAPGGGAQLRLRGISTINGQSSPLYVVDGVIISNVAISNGANAVTGAQAGGNASTQDNPVNRVADLNPNDIETLEVLKGASAAALYGSKASNGVVIITTKRGRNGENHASVTQRVGFSQISNTLGSRKFNSINDVKSTFCDPDGTAEECDEQPLVQEYLAGGGKTYNHESEITQIPFAMETLGSASGGTDNGNYYGSVLVADNPGVIGGTFYKKQTGRLAIGYKFGDRVRFGLTANVIHSTTDRGLTNNDNNNVSNYLVLAATPSFVNLQPQNGAYPSNIAVGGGANPVQTVELYENREDVWRMITGSTMAVDAYSSKDGKQKVKVIGNLGVDSFQQKNKVLSPNGLTFEPTDGLPGTTIDASSANLNWNIGAGIVWTAAPQNNSFRSALSAGVTYESSDLDSVYVVGRSLTAGQSNVDSATSIQTNQIRQRTEDSGFYAQEEVALLDERLSLLGGLLAERSSLNGDTSAYFFYPKVAGAFSLIAPAKAGESQMFAGLDSFRVRGAYGQTGNRPNYGNKFTPLTASNTVDGNAGLTINGAAGDTGIEPERQREFELGTDIALKDQRATLELTGYRRDISNLLLQRGLATSTGFTTQFANGGALRNLGIELAASARPLSSPKAEWTTRATLTLNRSKVTELPDGITPFNAPGAGFGAGLGAFRIEKGKSATQIVATVDDIGTLAAVGNGEPDFRIGWSNVVTAGDFTFSALLDWQQGSDIVNLTRLLYDGANNSPDVEAAAKRTALLADSDPRGYIEDASFLKVREISIGYSLPKHIAKHLGALKSLDFSLSGRNLLTFTPYSGLDPEVSNFGGQPIGRNYDVAPYPPSRSFWFSVTAGI